MGEIGKERWWWWWRWGLVTGTCEAHCIVDVPHICGRLNARLLDVARDDVVNVVVVEQRVVLNFGIVAINDVPAEARQGEVQVEALVHDTEEGARVLPEARA